MAGLGATHLSEASLLTLTGEDILEDIRELTLRNHKLHSFNEGETSRLVNLEVMSLSHNLLTSLSGFQHLKHLVSLNLNFNALTSLEGIGSCTALQNLFAANNRVRDVSPLVPCTNLQTLHLFRNNIADADMTMIALSSLPGLRELDLAGNPCSLAPDYKHRVVLQLELQSLDGEAVTQLDYDLANEYFASSGGMPLEWGRQVEILTLEDIDGSGTSGPARIADAQSNSYEQGAVPAAAASTAAAVSTTTAAAAGAATAKRPSAGSGSAPQGADVNSRPITAAAWSPSLSIPGSNSSWSAAAAARSTPAGTDSSTAATTTLPQPPLLLPRPGTTARRPGSSAGPSSRPGSAFSGMQPLVHLISNEILNDHPLIIEYLAKHVLMEGLALAEQQNGGVGRPGSGGHGGCGPSARGPSFAQRLRDTAAAMNACEDLDPKRLAQQQQELISTPSTVRRGMAEEMVSSATPHELCRQLIRLCEVLIKEVEAWRSGRSGSDGSSARPGTAAGFRPMTSGGVRTTTSAGASSSALTSAEVGELMQLRSEVERLCRENKSLRLENDNMFWLVEEIKRLKANLAKSPGM